MQTRDEVIVIRDTVRDMRQRGMGYEEIAAIMQFDCGYCEALAYDLDLILFDDAKDIDVAIAKLMTDNPKALQDYKGGKESAIGSLVGMIKKGNPLLDARRVRERLVETLNG